MVSAVSLRRYLELLDDVIRTENTKTAEELQDEVIAVFGSELDGLSSKLTNYQPCFMATVGGKTYDSSSPVDFIKDARILRSRLQVELDKLTSQSDDSENIVQIMRDCIFISHRTLDSAVADMIKDFLVNTGIPNKNIFCSSLPGNDVAEKISPEVKDHLKRAAINILILSNDYYKSTYCLNEAGIAWYLDEALVVPIGLPEISENNMVGFINSDYKLRRLDIDVDIAYLYDKASECLNGNVDHVTHSVITQETKKLKEKYKKHIERRAVNKAITDDNDPDEVIDYDDDVSEDGYHKVMDGDGRVLQEGEFECGHLIEGIEYNIIIRVTKGEEDKEEPVPFDELKDENWHYEEYGQYDGVFDLMICKEEILEEGLQFFYVVDKKVQTAGKLVKPTFKNFRTLESFLENEEPDELDYIRTGIRKYTQTEYADIEV